jgi:hypothetical protein
MVAAQKFNQAQGLAGTVYGVVTTGLLWRFLKLDEAKAAVDIVEYPIQSPQRIFGILTAIALSA